MKNYCIIDHAGSVGAFRALYKKAFAAAAEYEKAFTLKGVCEAYSPFAKEVTSKMKFYHRYNRTPQHVFLVCASRFTPQAQFIAGIWEDRGIGVTYIEEDVPVTHTYIEEISKARRCAFIWGAALGWPFSAPLFRDPRCEEIDMYTKREDLNSNEAAYAAKRNSRLEGLRSVASEEECKEFMHHYAYLYKNNLLAESLEPGWMLCPNCGRPVHEGAECTWCNEATEGPEVEGFYEDSYVRISASPDIDVTHTEMAIKKYAQRKAAEEARKRFGAPKKIHRPAEPTSEEKPKKIHKLAEPAKPKKKVIPDCPKTAYDFSMGETSLLQACKNMVNRLSF